MLTVFGDGIVGRAARERRQAEARKAGLLWLDIINASTELWELGVDYVKQRVFSIPLQLPIQTGCKQASTKHDVRVVILFAHLRDRVDVQLKESNPNTF